MNKFKNLKRLFVAYFNQDFPDITGSVEDTIKTFSKEWSTKGLFNTLLEIQDIYSKYPDNNELTDFLNDYFEDSEYNFLYDFPDGRAWLEYVECIIKEELKKRSGEDNNSN